MDHWYKSDLGNNASKLAEVVSKYSNSEFVDLGVRTGVSSEILLDGAEERGNHVYGVDLDFTLCPISNENPRYTKILGDSVSVGRRWEGGKISGIFFDTLHTKFQVMCELRYWWPHLKSKCFLAFHDSAWPEGKHDVINGVKYDRVEEGIKSFFGVKKMDHKDTSMSMSTYPDSWGMTIVEIRKKKDYASKFKGWDSVLEERNGCISSLYGHDNQGGLILDRIIPNV